MFSNPQIRPAKPHRRKPSMAARSGVTKRRVSHVTTSASDVPSLSFMEGLFGEEFPETFTGSDGRTMKSMKNILDLPAELLAIVSENLSKLDIKRLRLASKHLAVNVDLRIHRIYISPNRANLDCLQKILEHPRYKFQVLEIIWDDAQLDEYPDLDSFRNAIRIEENNTQQEIEHLLEIGNGDHEEHSGDTHAFEHEDFFDKNGRLTEVAKGVLLRHDNQVSRDIIAKNAIVMGVEESYEIYQGLYQDEQDIMKAKLDVSALQHALAVCPKLERITLTSEVWRPWNFQPAYVTPFYRSLPPGFRKPSVWPWLSYRPQATPAQVAHRDKIMNSTITEKSESLPHEFRGYSIIVSALISMGKPTQISEFIIYAGSETTGISHQLFATFNSDWTNTITMARVVPLKRLKLSLNSYGADHSITNSYLRSGQIHAALRTMPLLEHLDLSPNCFRRRDEPGVEECVFYWHDIIPLNLVNRLKTFALRNVNIVFEELLDLTWAMVNAQHITFDNLRMDSIEGFEATYFKLFRKLWIHYEITSTPCSRPAFTVIEPIRDASGAEAFRSKIVFEELCHFLYNEEDHVANPFEDRSEGQIKEEVGWVVDDRHEGFVIAAREYGKVKERKGM